METQQPPQNQTEPLKTQPPRKDEIDLQEVAAEVTAKFNARVDQARDLMSQLRRVSAYVLDKLGDFKGSSFESAAYHLAQGNYDDAVFRFRVLTRFYPNFPEAWAGLGESYRLKGEREKAREALVQALKLRPGHPVATESLQLLNATPSAPPAPQA